jgi:hypothetical protein
MYYCNKCGQEMVDSGHRCGVQSKRLTSVVRSNATTGWISVKDRLPDNLFVRCLVSMGNDRYIKIKEYDPSFWQSVNITHWMPLPEAPEV